MNVRAEHSALEVAPVPFNRVGVVDAARPEPFDVAVGDAGQVFERPVHQLQNMRTGCRVYSANPATTGVNTP